MTLCQFGAYDLYRTDSKQCPDFLVIPSTLDVTRSVLVEVKFNLRAPNLLNVFNSVV